MQQSGVILCSAPSPGMAVVTLNRPDKLNSLNLEVKRALVSALDRLGRDDEVRTIVLAGSHRAFAAGSDVAEMRDMTPASHRELKTDELFAALRASEKITIAAVEGYALGGGCELVLACDMIVASETARFGLPEITVGIMPGAGGTQYLARAFGFHRAMYLLLTGDHFGAQEAFEAGLVSKLAPAGQALAEALDLARRIAETPLHSSSAIKRAVRRGMDLGFTQALAHERSLFEALFATHDQREGMTAFLEKRKPSYEDR